MQFWHAIKSIASSRFHNSFKTSSFPISEWQALTQVDLYFTVSLQRIAWTCKIFSHILFCKNQMSKLQQNKSQSVFQVSLKNQFKYIDNDLIFQDRRSICWRYPHCREVDWRWRCSGQSKQLFIISSSVSSLSHQDQTTICYIKFEPHGAIFHWPSEMQKALWIARMQSLLASKYSHEANLFVKGPLCLVVLPTYIAYWTGLMKMETFSNDTVYFWGIFKNTIQEIDFAGYSF